MKLISNTLAKLMKWVMLSLTLINLGSAFASTEQKSFGSIKIGTTEFVNAKRGAAYVDGQHKGGVLSFDKHIGLLAEVALQKPEKFSDEIERLGALLARYSSNPSSINAINTNIQRLDEYGDFRFNGIANFPFFPFSLNFGDNYISSELAFRGAVNLSFAGESLSGAPDDRELASSSVLKLNSLASTDFKLSYSRRFNYSEGSRWVVGITAGVSRLDLYREARSVMGTDFDNIHNVLFEEYDANVVRAHLPTLSSSVKYSSSDVSIVLGIDNVIERSAVFPHLEFICNNLEFTEYDCLAATNQQSGPHNEYYRNDRQIYIHLTRNNIFQNVSASYYLELLRANNIFGESTRKARFELTYERPKSFVSGLFLGGEKNTIGRKEFRVNMGVSVYSFFKISGYVEREMTTYRGRRIPRTFGINVYFRSPF